MENLFKKLQRDYPKLHFVLGKEFCWSPKTQEIVIKKGVSKQRTAAWSLLHEVGHALLEHATYQSDLELLQLEAAAWHKAQEIGKSYGYEISEDHIQDCMDTYRDWLHQRSACPACNTRSFQQDSSHYQCLNCSTMWSVSASRFCRPYRRKQASQESANHTAQKATFV